MSSIGGKVNVKVSMNGQFPQMGAPILRDPHVLQGDLKFLKL